MNQQKLYERMKQKGVSKKDVYQRLKISRSAFYRKCTGKSEFKLEEIQTLMDMLGLKTANGIFFE